MFKMLGKAYRVTMLSTLYLFLWVEEFETYRTILTYINQKESYKFVNNKKMRNFNRTPLRDNNIEPYVLIKERDKILFLPIYIYFSYRNVKIGKITNKSF